MSAEDAHDSVQPQVETGVVDTNNGNNTNGSQEAKEPSASVPVMDASDFPALGNAASAKRPAATNYTSIISAVASGKGRWGDENSAPVSVAASSSSASSSSASSAKMPPGLGAGSVVAGATSVARPTSASTVASAASSSVQSGLGSSGIAVVKSVLSGDTFVIRGRPSGGPPPELVFTLSSISAPRFGQPFRSDALTETEPFGIEAREFLRKNLVGKEVKYVVDKPRNSTNGASGNGGSNREFGYAFLREPVNGETNVNKLVLREGLAQLRRSQQSLNQFVDQLKSRKVPVTFNVNTVVDDLDYDSFVVAESSAKRDHKNIWYNYDESQDETLNEVSQEGDQDSAKETAAHKKNEHSAQFGEPPKRHLPVKDLSGENLRLFFSKFQGLPVHSIIEQVRDGATFRIYIPSSSPEKIPSLYGLVMLSGAKAPATASPNNPVSEPYGEQSKFFVESRLLQRDIQFIPEAVVNDTLVGSVKIGSINLALALLSEGLATVQDWGLTAVTEKAELYRKAEEIAHSENKNIWSTGATRGQRSGTVQIGSQNSATEFDATIVRIFSGDTYLVEKRGGNKEELRVVLSSARAPRSTQNRNEDNSESGIKEFGLDYDAKEYMRTKYIGKQCHVKIDYIQPANQGYEERACVTIVCEGKNIAEVGINRGYLDLMHHRKDDNNRSAEYLTLSTAFDVAKTRKKGIHSTKPYSPKRIVDASVKLVKAKQYFPFLERSGSLSGVVDYVVSGSRFRVYIPSQSCIITLLLAAIRTPRTNEEFGEEALALSQRNYLQRDVEIQVLSTDRSGGFIGCLSSKTTGDAAKLLVNHGLAYVQDRGLPTAQLRELQDLESQVVDKKVIRPPPKEEPEVVRRVGDDDYSDDEDYF